MKEKVTIRDVAERAGVSIATVSRVLNKPELVEVETKNRVREAMEELDFQPNAIARGLSSKNTNTLGVVIPGINDLFFNEFYRGVERASQKNNMKVLLFDSQYSRQRTFEGFTFLKQHQVGGIIFTSRHVDEDYDPVLERIGIPVVLALTQSSCKKPLPAFKVDDIKAMFDVIAFLVSRGHRRIGMISARLDDEMTGDDVTGEYRLRGYEAGLRHYGIEYRPEYVEVGDYRFDSGYRAMQRLLQRQDQNRLTAICTASDEMAIGAIRCLHDNGLRIPEDMSVVGFDDLSIARMMIPSLTTVAQPFAEIGEKAVQCLVEMIQAQKPHLESGVYYVPHQLVQRESVRTLTELESGMD